MTSIRRHPVAADDAGDHDVIIVGSGATGGWAAKVLAERGARVLVLEAGDDLDPGKALNEHTWAPEARFRGGLLPLRARQPVQSRHPAFHRLNHHLFVDDVDNPYTTPESAPFLWIRSRQVGGRSLMWMGTTLRMSDFELKAASRDGLGVDWPVCHADLDRSYRTVEEFLGVMGSNDGLEELPDGEFVPPSPMTPAEQEFKAAVEAAWSDRHVIHARGVPVRTAPFPSAPGSWPRFTSVGSTLAAARATGNLTLRAGAIVDRILTASRRAIGVRFVDRHERGVHERRAKVIMLCGSTVESIRLLLNSATADFPTGLGNSSGLLGHCVMDHPSVGATGVLRRYQNCHLVDELNGPNGIYLPRFRNLHGRTSEFARGYGVWGRLQRGEPRHDGGASIRLAAVCEMLARVENRVTIDPSTKDAWGIPVARIDCRHSDNEREMMKDAARSMTEMIELVGGEVEHVSEFLPGQTIHEVGGARMGASAADSVVDEFCRLWDVDNVFVTDGACWPSSGYQNPTLTMMAVTVRACAAVLQQLTPRNDRNAYG